MKSKKSYRKFVPNKDIQSRAYRDALNAVAAEALELCDELLSGDSIYDAGYDTRLSVRNPEIENKPRRTRRSSIH